MAIAAVYDIHGNRPALEAVLAEIRRLPISLLIVGGDVVLGPMPRECLDLLSEFEIPTRFLMGNTDREVLAQAQGIETDWFCNSPERWRIPVTWVAGQLTRDHADMIQAWPKTVRVELAEMGEVLFCHATPHNDTDVFTRETPEEGLRSVFEGLDAAAVICGHTHMQFDRKIGNTRVVNAGSVGMPFGEPGAYWLVIEDDIYACKTEYDFGAASERISATQFPFALDFAENNVVTPPSEATMLARFAQMAIRE